MEINIKGNKEDKVLEFVNAAISLFDPDSTIRGPENIHKINEYTYALSNIIGIQGIKNFNDSQLLIKRAIYKSKEHTPLTLHDFVNALN